MTGPSATAGPVATRSRSFLGIGAHGSGTVAGPDPPPNYPRVRTDECVASTVTLVLAQPLVVDELGRSVYVLAPATNCNFYIEFYE